MRESSHFQKKRNYQVWASFQTISTISSTHKGQTENVACNWSWLGYAVQVYPLRAAESLGGHKIIADGTVSVSLRVARGEDGHRTLTWVSNAPTNHLCAILPSGEEARGDRWGRAAGEGFIYTEGECYPCWVQTSQWVWLLYILPSPAHPHPPPPPTPSILV